MREEYLRRLEARRQEAARHQRLFNQLGSWRLLTVVAGAVLTWYRFWLLPVPFAIFVALLLYHERISRKAAVDRRAVTYYEHALARLDGKWAGRGEDGTRFADPHHPYSADLDVFGHGSLFQLVNASRTLAGEETLARWLLAPSPAEKVLLRQEAVSELRERVDLREDLALFGEEVRAGLHSGPLLLWGRAPAVGVTAAHRILAAVLTGSLLLTFFGYMFQLWTLAPVLLTILGVLVFYSFHRRRVGQILGGMELAGRDLSILAGLIGRLERETFASARLRALMEELRSDGVPASRQIARLRRLIEFRDQARHQMYAIVAEPLLWSAHFAFAIERWRLRSGPRLGAWLAAAGEIEALSSIAGYAAEHPDDPFPTLVADGPTFDGTGVAHPLLPAGAVRNDVLLGSPRQMLLISGSNMSGKSTLLRSVGLNAAMAWAGLPVRALSLRISPLSVGASMRVQDSLLEGASRFYAEITRLRQVVGMASGAPPLLFLLDEVLSGTNSHDRLIGAEAVVRTLLRSGSIGLVTTHDLALARIAEELPAQTTNVHFQDHIEDGRIAFDYRMRPGIVQKSNALELMRSVGLEV